jgi:membrane peptidoglycan carboxypeptidase
MHERGTLSDEEWAEAQANPTLPLTLGESGQMMPVSASQIRDPAIRELAALDLNLPGGDRILRVPLYFEAVSQLYVERAISHHPQLAQAGYTVSVYVVNNETGGVEAVYNPQASFYPASTLKPFITLCLLRQGMDRWSLVADEPVGSPPLRNSYNGYFGSMPLGVALARSTNTVFLSALDRFGQGCTAESIAAAGGTLTLPEAENRTIALGSAPVDVMQFLQSYVAIASCGETGTVRYLREVREGGRTLHRVRTEPADMAQDMQDEINELLAMMEGAAQPGGTAAGIIVDRPVAAKTGTAQGNRQISFLSLTGNYTVLVTAFADPANIRTPLPSTALMPLAREINANIHLAHPVGERELGCRVENVAEAER